jgi:hypothetical protein
VGGGHKVNEQAPEGRKKLCVRRSEAVLDTGI